MGVTLDFWRAGWEKWLLAGVALCCTSETVLVVCLTPVKTKIWVKSSVCSRSALNRLNAIEIFYPDLSSWTCGLPQVDQICSCLAFIFHGSWNSNGFHWRNTTFHGSVMFSCFRLVTFFYYLFMLYLFVFLFLRHRTRRGVITRHASGTLSKFRLEWKLKYTLTKAMDKHTHKHTHTPFMEHKHLGWDAEANRSYF